jgi:hypothetical protein
MKRRLSPISGHFVRIDSFEFLVSGSEEPET